VVEAMDSEDVAEAMEKEEDLDVAEEGEIEETVDVEVVVEEARKKKEPGFQSPNLDDWSRMD